MIKNRLLKNIKKITEWSKRHDIQAYRIYDRDIPEYPYIVDRYLDYILIYDKSDKFIDQNKKDHLDHLLQAVREIYNITSSDKIIIKARERQQGEDQYEKLNDQNKRFVVKESQAQLYINLWDYLDTGLFLDHRPMRQWMLKNSKDKKVLNLFCYTGSVSVFSAIGDGVVTSVDMSNTYLKWAQDNFTLNNLSLHTHQFIQADVLAWIKNCTEKFDLIFLDPPTFSNSKRMNDTFDVQRDQLQIILDCMKVLNKNGVLIFSNNKRGFKLEVAITEIFQVKDVTKASIPIDFHDQKIHVCFEIRHKSS